MENTKGVKNAEFEILLPELKLIEDDYYSEEFGGNLPLHSYDIPHWVAIGGGLTIKLIPILSIATAFKVVATIREIEDLTADSLRKLRHEEVLFCNYDSRLLRSAAQISIKTAQVIASVLEISLKEAKYVGLCFIVARIQLPFYKIEKEQLFLQQIIKLFRTIRSLKRKETSAQRFTSEFILTEAELDEKFLDNGNIQTTNDAIALTTAKYVSEIVHRTTINEVASRLDRTMGLTIPPNLTKAERIFFRKTQAQHNYICDNWGRDNTMVTREMMDDARKNLSRWSQSQKLTDKNAEDQY